MGVFLSLKPIDSRHFRWSWLVNMRFLACLSRSSLGARSSVSQSSTSLLSWSRGNGGAQRSRTLLPWQRPLRMSVSTCRTRSGSGTWQTATRAWGNTSRSRVQEMENLRKWNSVQKAPLEITIKEVMNCPQPLTPNVPLKDQQLNNFTLDAQVHHVQRTCRDFYFLQESRSSQTRRCAVSRERLNGWHRYDHYHGKCCFYFLLRRLNVDWKIYWGINFFRLRIQSRLYL